MIHLSFEQRSSGTVVTTINFNTEGRTVMNSFTPQTAEVSPVVDAFDLYIKGSDAAGLQSLVREIEALLDFAKKNPTGPEGVWVLYSPDSGQTAWHARLSGGALLMDTRMGALWRESKTRAQVVFERQHYWEAQAPVTLTLTNGAVTEQTAAPISNAQDASRELYVEIGADQVYGVLPTPAILEFENTKNDATLLDDLLVGVLQGDGASTPPTPGALVREGSGSADASCSGGSYAVLSWAVATETQLTTWTIASGSFLQKRYRAVARLQAPVVYTDLYLKAKLLAGTTVIAETRWSLVEAGDELVIIGSLNIPPYALGEAIDLGNITLALYEKHSTGSGTLNLDYILLMPQDSWRRYGAMTGMADGETLVDDPVREVLVTKYGTSYKVTHKIEEGKPLMLRPGVKNFLYFLQQDTDGDAPIARTASVTVKAHPRRLTV
jgi:hypothetical protein